MPIDKQTLQNINKNLQNKSIVVKYLIENECLTPDDVIELSTEYSILDTNDIEEIAKMISEENGTITNNPSSQKLAFAIREKNVEKYGNYISAFNCSLYFLWEWGGEKNFLFACNYLHLAIKNNGKVKISNNLINREAIFEMANILEFEYERKNDAIYLIDQFNNKVTSNNSQKHFDKRKPNESFYNFIRLSESEYKNKLNNLYQNDPKFYYSLRVKQTIFLEKAHHAYKKGIVFTSNFSLSYGNDDQSKKEHKKCIVDDKVENGLTIHQQQAIFEAMIKNHSNKGEDTLANRAWDRDRTTYLIANIGCIITDRAWKKNGNHKRIFITMPIYINHAWYKLDKPNASKKIIISDSYINEKNRDKESIYIIKENPIKVFYWTRRLEEWIKRDDIPFEKWPDIIKSFNVGESTKPALIEKIKSLCNAHAEKSFLYYISVKKNLQIELSNLFTKNGIRNYQDRKVYSIIFDLHGSQDMCDGCDSMLFTAQSENGNLYKLMREVLEGTRDPHGNQSSKRMVKKLPERNPTNFKIIFRYSAPRPFIYGPIDYYNKHNNLPWRDYFYKRPKEESLARNITYNFSPDIKKSDSSVILHSDANNDRTDDLQKMQRGNLAGWYEESTYEALPPKIFLPLYTVFINASGDSPVFKIPFCLNNCIVESNTTKSNARYIFLCPPLPHRHPSSILAPPLVPIL